MGLLILFVAALPFLFILACLGAMVATPFLVWARQRRPPLPRGE
jgi:hypothetical protein